MSIEVSGECFNQFENWFARCSIMDVHPLVLALFSIKDAQREEVIEYSLEPDVYESWLWADEAAMCIALGCTIIAHEGWGWLTWLPPTKKAPRYQDETRSFIYGLADPITQEIRYVGITDNPQKRFTQHIYDMSESEKVEWIRQLRAQGLIPRLIILEEVIGRNALDREQWWIRHYEQLGHRLTNSNSQYRKKP